MSDKNTHENVFGYMHKGFYIIGFRELIYDNWQDGVAMYEVLKVLLKPESYDSFGGWEDMKGTFVKDNIRVDTYWTNMMDCFWEIETDDEAVQKKVYGWACEAYDEYARIFNKDNYSAKINELKNMSEL